MIKSNSEYYTTDLGIASTKLNIHPQSEYILEQAQERSKALGIYSDAFYNGHHTMTPYIFIDTDVKRSIITTIWFSTLYFLDDFFGEDMKQKNVTLNFKVLFSAWTNGNFDRKYLPEQSKILFEAVAYCSRQIQVNSNAAFFKRYTEYLYQHMQYTLHPVNYKTVEEYIESRIFFGGMYPTMGMIEYTNNIYIDEVLLAKCPAMEQAIRSCALIGVLSNDLISYHKEKHSQQNLLNAYLKTKSVNNLSDAIEKGIVYVNDCYTNFVQSGILARQQILALSPQEQQTINIYLIGLERLIAASYHWQMSTNRYRSEENVFEDLKMTLGYSNA